MEVGWLHVPTKMLTATGLHASKGRPVGFATYVPLKLQKAPYYQTNKQKQQTHGNLLNRECESKKIRTLPCAHDALPAMNDYMGGRILRGNQPRSSVTGTASSAIVPLV